jgi:hypothetical protein
VKVFGWSVALIPLGFSIIAWVGGEVAAVVIFLGFNLLLNLPHQYGTWRRIVTERRLDAQWLLVGAVVAVLMMSVLVAPTWVRSLVLGDLFVYWGLHHLAVQSLGIGRILARRGGVEPAPLSHDRWLHLGMAFLIVLWAHAATPMSYHLMGDVVELQRLPLTALTSTMLMALVVLAALVLLAWRARRWRHLKGKEVTDFEIGTVLGIIAALSAPSLPVTIAGLTAVHNVQYLTLVDRQQQRRGLARRWWDLGIVVLYVTGVAAVFLWNVTVGAVFFATLVSWHYLADARLWRPSRDPALARELGLAT